MDSKNEKMIELLKDKSVEAFLLAIETFNKPTIKYRLEGCIFFLCNAWELLLKAKLLKDNQTIYYPGESGRTFSLNDCMKKVFNNEKDPVYKNLVVISSFRNIATHLIIPEYEFSYMPFLSFCVKSYADKLYHFLNVNISNYISTNFLSLFINKQSPIDAELLKNYGQELASIFKAKTMELETLYNCEEGSSIAYDVNITVSRISNKNQADYTFYASNNPKDKNVTYITKHENPNSTHPYTHHKIAKEIDELIKKGNIAFTPIKQPISTPKNPNPALFTTACLDVLLKKVGLEQDTKYVVKIENGHNPIKKYSKELITKVISLISDDKDIVIKNK